MKNNDFRVEIVMDCIVVIAPQYVFNNLNTYCNSVFEVKDAQLSVNIDKHLLLATIQPLDPLQIIGMQETIKTLVYNCIHHTEF